MLSYKIQSNLIKELKTGELAWLPADTMVSNYNFNKKYKTGIPGREQWNDGSPVKAMMRWYTECSKTAQGTGAISVWTKN